MNIAAFAASSVMEVYSEPVRQVGEILGKNGHTLIFGGCDFGLMHEIAEGFVESHLDGPDNLHLFAHAL